MSPEKNSIDLIFNTLKNNSLKERFQSINTRKTRLRQLRKWILANRPAIHEALYSDFRKNPAEVDGVEIFHVLNEITHTISHLDTWARPTKVDAPLTMLGSRSQIWHEPKGVCLIISPWNYPFSLTVGPLISALAAGNCVVVKPSEITVHAAALIERLVKEVFDPQLVVVQNGGVELTTRLLELPFDHIFFTGSPGIGKIVMSAAAKNLTSVTLELGGKSPTIITSNARLKEAAERIAIAKFVNNGQTCVAPDYVLVHKSVSSEFIKLLQAEIQDHFNSSKKGFQDSPDYCRISSDKHFTRVQNLILEAQSKGNQILMGGNSVTEDRYIEPTLIAITNPDCQLLTEEIFGPVLPILVYEEDEWVVNYINQRPKPLGLYVFTSRKSEIDFFKSRTSSGGMCVNECAIHFLHPNLPFGGVNNSGIGKSHGHSGFLAFTNQKAVLKQFPWVSTVKLFYPPYTNRSKRLFNLLFRFL